MVVKVSQVEELGAAELLLPARIGAALRANDQAKFWLTLLQAAREQATAPRVPAPDLRRERVAAGLDRPELDDAAADARLDAEGRLVLAEGPAALDGLVRAVAQMTDPLPEPERAEARARLDGLAAELPADGRLPPALVDRLASGDGAAGDSIHLLVMDLHRRINRLQAAIAVETVDGASVYGLSAAGRAAVAAFMAGLNRTAPLKFDHPGLGTTATEVDGRILIQNDIGTTDAHVLVVTVADLAVTVTYSDIHPERLRFFRRLFGTFEVDWNAAEDRHSARVEGGTYILSVGTFRAADRAGLHGFLAFLGSRLVFLIDWNKARKRLKPFLRKGDVLAVLQWAADHDVGHRGFLAIGGERAVYEAVEFAAAGRLHYGDRLDELLGPEQAADYLRFVLRTAAEGLLQGRTLRLIRDELKADLSRRLLGSGESLMRLALRHAGFVAELADTARAGLCGLGDGPGIAAAAVRARRWERRADELLNRVREAVRRDAGNRPFVDFVEAADDAADELEEAVFVLTLLAEHAGGSAAKPALRLADIAAEDAGEFVSCLAAAAAGYRGDTPEDLEDALAAIERVVALEHAADDALRAMDADLVREAADFRILHLYWRLGRCLEAATDALALASQTLRNHLMDQVVNR